MLKPTIGIEVHVQLNTKLKSFSKGTTDFNKEANTNVSIVDLGYPGTLPKLNKEVMQMALKTALVLNCKINKEMIFDRKNYFYPDLPKGYQITQSKTPIGYDGFVSIIVDGEVKNIGIERIHIEEDTAKSVHTSSETLLNFNRAGVPLVEIVTKPDISSAKEAMAYIKKLREMLLYLEVSDVKMEEGSMRCDANISLSETSKLGVKSEIKNIGSISAVGASIDFEIKRQTELLNNNVVLKEETRRYDDKIGETILMRVKETGNDYRYFSEPDLGVFTLSDDEILKTKENLPKLPEDLRKLYEKLNLSSVVIDSLLANLDLNKIFMKIKDKVNPVKAANVLTGEILSYLNKNNLSINETEFTIKNFIDLIDASDKNIVSSKGIKEVINVIMNSKKTTEEIISDLGLKQISDITLIKDIVKKVIDANNESVLDYKNGKDRAIKYLMGQVMKESKGKANPKTVNQLLIEMLKEL